MGVAKMDKIYFLCIFFISKIESKFHFVETIDNDRPPINVDEHGEDYENFYDSNGMTYANYINSVETIEKSNTDEHGQDYEHCPDDNEMNCVDSNEMNYKEYVDINVIPVKVNKGLDKEETQKKRLKVGRATMKNPKEKTRNKKEKEESKNLILTSPL